MAFSNTNIMNDRLFTAALPFKRKGTGSMNKKEFIMILSMDLNWFKPETARLFMRYAIDEGIISREGDILTAQFDIESVKIPMGFKPDETLLREKDVLDLIVERIMENTGHEKKSIIAEINKKRTETRGLLTIEVLGILTARDYGIQMADLISHFQR